MVVLFFLLLQRLIDFVAMFFLLWAEIAVFDDFARRYFAISALEMLLGRKSGRPLHLHLHLHLLTIDYLLKTVLLEFFI